jgi:hypothetical protein
MIAKPFDALQIESLMESEIERKRSADEGNA